MVFSGWKRPAKYFGLSSLYDGCMTVKLAYNGSVLAQNAVIYSQCLQYQKDVPISLRPHSGSFFFEKNCPKIGPYFGKPIKENMCMGNTMKSCIFEILRIFLHRFKYTNCSLYDIRKYFQKYNWKYHLSAVLGAVIKCQKSTGSAWETLHYTKLYF